MAQWLIIIYLLLYTHSTQVYAKIEQQQRSHLYHLNMNYDGEEIEDEFFSGTAEYPFWVVNQNKWVQMGDLKENDQLLLHQGATPAYVLSNQRENAPPGETFTTYNFDVEDFHTYFVGESGVWVHNRGAACERAFAIWIKFLARESGDHWKAFNRTLNRLSNATLELRQQIFKEVLEEFAKTNPSKLKVFPTLLPPDTVGSRVPSIASLKSVTGPGTSAKQFDYIVTRSGELRVGEKHSFMAAGEEIIAAGRVGIKNGEVRILNNFSGHYKPTGVESGIVEGAWRSHGFDEVVELYKEPLQPN